MTDYTNLQSRCQRGEASLSGANNLLAECHAELGKLIAERDQLNAAISTPESVFINMKSGRIARISLRSAIDLHGEVINGDDAQQIEIAKLRAEVAGLKTGFEAYERVKAELKAEVEALRKYREEFAVLAERRREEADALRKDSESYRLLSFCHGQGTLELVRSHHELCAEIRRLKILAGEPVPPTPEEFIGPSPEGPTARIRRKLAALGQGEQS
ncbi:hypothetical protein [Pseudomonas sp. PS01302]|uniref:hypothetical protein n=1 Tax=Pseudomonas sp. PS01302 TaxID=2991438 RepID=UPI00249BDCFC|nr:hypothetical protein [Pseudomonas sp. PS01302]